MKHPYRIASTALLALLAGSALACEAPNSGAPTQDGQDEATKAGEADTDGGASDETKTAAPPSLAALGANPFAMLAKMDEPGRYDAPKKSEGFDEDAPHVLVLDLDTPLAEVEQMSFSLFGSEAGQSERELFEKLDKAAANEMVTGLVVRVDVGMGMAGAQRLHDALVRFKGEDARKVTCHAENVSNGTYYALTACDELVLAPLGSVMIPGPAATPVHLKRMLDKVGVRAQMLHIGAYKGAAEPLTRTEPSPEMRETLDAILTQQYETLLDGLEKRRGLDHEAAIAAVDRGLFLADQAKEAGLIDDVATYEASLAKTAGDGGWTRLKVGKSSLSDPAAMPKLLGLVPPDIPKEDHVALVYAVGGVVDGSGQGTIGARQQIASGTLVPALLALAEDDAVKAVVLRVDSPGGSALASEQIWQATKILAEKKPLIVSMGDVAASGGYYVSAAAEKIFAEPNTLTGSIGVVGGKIVYDDALAKIGVDAHGITKGKRGLMWTAMDAWDEEEQQVMRDYMQSTYDTFVDRVAAGRGMKREDVHEVAQGRVWTGAAAKSHGLVDELGSLDDALAYAHQKAGIDLDTKLEVYPPEPTLKDMFASFGNVSMGVDGQVRLGTDPLPLPLRTALGELARLDAGLAAQIEHTFTLVFDLRDQKLWALELLPPIR